MLQPWFQDIQIIDYAHYIALPVPCILTKTCRWVVAYVIIVRASVQTRQSILGSDRMTLNWRDHLKNVSPWKV